MSFLPAASRLGYGSSSSSTAAAIISLGATHWTQPGHVIECLPRLPYLAGLHMGLHLNASLLAWVYTQRARLSCHTHSLSTPIQYMSGQYESTSNSYYSAPSFMSTSPTTGLRQLNLHGMAPTTRAQAMCRLAEAGALAGEYSDTSDSDSDFEGEDTGQIVRSPFTGLLYDISRLPTQDSSQGTSHSLAVPDQLGHDRDAQGHIRELFSELRWHETPPVSLHFTGVDGGHQFYAFQLREFTPLSIRIGTPDSKWPGPQCTCKNRKPCHHLLWLCDPIAKLTLYGHDQAEPLKVEADGSIPALGDLFQRIADYRLNLLTDDLHSAVGSSEAYRAPPWVRVDEVNQILSAFDETDDEEQSNSSKDTWTHRKVRTSRAHGEKRNLRETVRALLERNNEVFSIFLNLLSPRDRARNPYVRLQTRVDRILYELDRYAESLSDRDAARQRVAMGADLEGTCDVAWAARHVLGAVGQVKGELLRGTGAQEWERGDAARALVYILRKVVFEHDEDKHGGAAAEDRNLYVKLVGGRAASGFVVDVLELIPDQTQYIDELEDVKREIRAKRRVNKTWFGKLEQVIRLMRKSVVREDDKETGRAVGGGGHPPLSKSGTGVGSSARSSLSAGSKRRWEDD
ncbi:hypothetical protein PpBr36_05410 [Pyricularia pennisetigena]|uniref:hypothetical protein n=1 Tax=Pyricularia pennisetigena TaxID=1578925 RepID=UPI00114F8EC3|nr:hypothetical protein PpBr36_05410 [Pyricularia pennisetigena]TLS26773.1 hypothetical protein PpBr36_05410 [Pyricularia pennisetigena]